MSIEQEQVDAVKKLQEDLQKALDQIKDLQEKNEDLKGAKQHAFEQVHELKAKLDDIAKAEDEKKTEDLKSKGNLEELINDLKTKLQQEKDEKVKMLQDWDNKELDGLAKDLARKLPIDEKNVRFLTRDIRERLVKQNGQVGVLGRDGKLTANSLDDLVKEIQDSDDYSHLIIDRQATGGGAQGSRNGGAVAKKFGEMSANEKAQLYREDPQKYEQLKQTDPDQQKLSEQLQ